MEPYTLNRSFHKQHIIDSFSSLIWTERYYGDGDAEIVVPATAEMIAKLPEGILLGEPGSEEIMIMETRDFDENGNMKLSGITLTKWLNNRFVRSSINPEDRYWYLGDRTPGEMISHIVFNMCMNGSPYLDGTIDLGLTTPDVLIVPGLELGDIDDTGDDIYIGVPYGPVYDAVRDIAVTYQVGMTIKLDSVDEDFYHLKFITYRGVDRTRNQTEYGLVRFSPGMDSLAKIKELESIANQKTIVWAFAPANPEGLAVIPGLATLGVFEGFDLRAMQLFAEDITTDMVEGDATDLANVLNSRAHDALTSNRHVRAVEGEIIPDSQFKYGVDYNLGDLVEVQGKSGAVQIARVIEYIRTQDATGEKAYPTVSSQDLGEALILPPGSVIPPDPPETALPRNLSVLGSSNSGTLDDFLNHTIELQDTGLNNADINDGILVLATAPSLPSIGAPLGLPIQCTDTAGNVYTLIHTSKFEASTPAVNDGFVACLFFCQQSTRPLVKAVDIITVEWDNDVYDRSIVAWLIRHDGAGANPPTVLAATSDSNTTVKASSQVTLASPAWIPARNNALEFALIFSWRPSGDPGGGGYGGVAFWDGFYEATSWTMFGSKGQTIVHQQTHGADVYLQVSGGDTIEIDLGELPNGITHAGFNGVAQNYSYGAGKWKGIILLAID